MHYSATDATGRQGVALTDLAVTTKLGWIFREMPTSDYGIDAQVELIDEDKTVTGQLLALQIKSGASFFRERNDTQIIFRPDEKHVSYWLRHQLPVLVVLVDPASATCYWQHVSEATLERTRSSGWKLAVPTSQTLSGETREQLTAIARADLYTARLRRLQLATPLMRLLMSGADMRLEVQEWVNKVWGKGSATLIAIAPDGEETRYDWPLLVLGSEPYSTVLPRLFPWATLTVDEDFYDRALELDPSDQAYLSDAIYPYTGAANGEVMFWRLRLTLNDLGRGLLAVDEHCADVDGWWALPPLRS